MGLMIAEKRKYYLNLKQHKQQNIHFHGTAKFGCPFLLPEQTAKKTGHGSPLVATAPRLSVGAVLNVCYAVERRFCRGRYQSLTPAGNAPGSP